MNSATVSDMDKILLGSKGVSKADINKVKRVYLDYVKRKLEEINEGFPLDEGASVVYELQEKYNNAEIDYDFDTLLDRLMDELDSGLKSFFKEFKRNIANLQVLQ